jgi:hypothetical protein
MKDEHVAAAACEAFGSARADSRATLPKTREDPT